MGLAGVIMMLNFCARRAMFFLSPARYKALVPEGSILATNINFQIDVREFMIQPPVGFSHNLLPGSLYWNVFWSLKF